MQVLTAQQELPASSVWQNTMNREPSINLRMPVAIEPFLLIFLKDYHVRLLVLGLSPYTLHLYDLTSSP
jgi:hypothetical protein